MRATHPVALLVLSLLTLFAPRASAHDGLREQIAVLATQIDAEPARADLYLRRGDLNRAAGNLAQARADLDRAASLDPHLIAVQLAVARLNLDEHRPSDAASAATRYLAVEGRHVQALLVRARAFARLGRRGDAVADFTRAIELEPVPDVVIERARLLEESPADLEEALLGVEDGRRRIGPVITLDLEALDIERRLRRYDAALRRLDDITARSPRKEQWLARRGSLLEEAGRPADALASYEAALSAAAALPQHVRDTRATRALISTIQNSLNRLTAGQRTTRAGRSTSR